MLLDTYDQWKPVHTIWIMPHFELRFIGSEAAKSVISNWSQYSLHVIDFF